MAVFSVFVGVFAPLANATQETLLAVSFGGVILGLGVGIVIRYGGCLDGTETVAILLNKKFGIPVGQTVLIINIVIYAIAGVLFGIVLLGVILFIPLLKWNRMEISQIFKTYE